MLSTWLADNTRGCRQQQVKKKFSILQRDVFTGHPSMLFETPERKGRIRVASVEYFKVDPVECFASTWQTAGFTTVSSIEDATRGKTGITGRKRRVVFPLLSRGFTSTMWPAYLEIVCEWTFFTNPFNL